MSTKTVVIAIDEKMDNFAVLGNRFDITVAGEFYNVYVHNNPSVNQSFVGVTANFDILFDGGYGRKDWADILPQHQHRLNKRFSKEIQAIKMADFHKGWMSHFGRPDPRFINIPTWSIGWNGRNYPERADAVVVKGKDGARGIGQFVINTVYVNLDYFLKRLDSLLKVPYNEGLLNDFIEQFGGHVVYGKGDENKPGEGLESLRDNGYFVQSLVSNINAEYRVLTDKDGKPAYIQRRKVRSEDTEYPQATGSGSVIDRTAIMTVDDFFETGFVHRQFFEDLCAGVVGPVSSIDVFTTSAGGWGVFEYCNQFGVSGVPLDIVAKLHVGYVGQAIEEYFAHA